jgi:molybdenum cofactor synthesis domain-containing protein
MMRPFSSTISLEEARRLLGEAILPIERVDRVPLEKAGGRVSARDVSSAIDVPPFARSVMDGYAVVSGDTRGATRSTPVSVRLVDRIYTGHMPVASVTVGTCAEIATGAPLPSGADAVVMVEETAARGTHIDLFAEASPGQHVGRRGGDIQAGSVVVRTGDVLTPSRIGSLAAIGCGEVEVFAQPRVAILSTGNEVVEPGRRLEPGQIFDVNRFSLSAIVAAHGGVPEPRTSVPDSIDALSQALDDCAQADLIVFSGGSSVGERDLIVDAVAARGRMIFHGIAIKPGKPTAFAFVNDKPFFGMPGNPTSCLSNAYILLVPFLRAVARQPPFVPRVARARLARRINAPGGRHQICTVRLAGDAAYPVFKGSGEITSLSQADGYFEIPANQAGAQEGAVVDVTLF